MSKVAYTPLTASDDVEKLAENVNINVEEDEYEIPQEKRRCSSFCVLRRLALLALAIMVLPSLIRNAPRVLRGVGCHRGFASNIPGALPSHYKLPSGDKIPSVALGVWQAKPNEVGEAIKAALKTGYRHIDGAWIYRNEKEVGQAIAQSDVKREDLWIASKLWNSFHDPSKVEGALDESLKNLGVDYLDLYLMHWPVAFKGDEKRENGKPVIDEKLTADPYPTWKKLEEMVKKGKVRNIGVSNFNIARLRNLTANDLKIQPAVNQVELNYWNPQPELVAYAKASGLLLEAYSPLGSGTLVKDTLNVPIVKDIAKQLNITPAQVIISWLVQRGTVTLPKSVNPTRVEENLRVQKLPIALFTQLEASAVAHKPKRAVNPSEGWGLDYDVFDDYPYKA